MANKMEHHWETLFGEHLSVILLSDKKFLVGVQIASLLSRETFNLYRSLKIKNVPITRASQEQIEFLTKMGAVKAGTHSVTLVAYEDAINFIEESMNRRRSESVQSGKKRTIADVDGSEREKALAGSSGGRRRSQDIEASGRQVRRTPRGGGGRRGIGRGGRRGIGRGGRSRRGRQSEPELDSGTGGDRNSSSSAGDSAEDGGRGDEGSPTASCRLLRALPPPMQSTYANPHDRYAQPQPQPHLQSIPLMPPPPALCMPLPPPLGTTADWLAPGAGTEALFLMPSSGLPPESPLLPPFLPSSSVPAAGPHPPLSYAALQYQFQQQQQQQQQYEPACGYLPQFAHQPHLQLYQQGCDEQEQEQKQVEENADNARYEDEYAESEEQEQEDDDDEEEEEEEEEDQENSSSWDDEEDEGSSSA